MRGDFSRLRFSRGKNYTSVLEQQGRVSLDADTNEQCAINDYLRATETVDVVGKVGGPVHDEGFKITVQGNTLDIGKGRYYVEGLMCENLHHLSYSQQDYLLYPNPTDQELLASLSSGAIKSIQVYLQVWQRLVTALDDPCLREPALGLADTTARLQTVWRVLAKGVTTSPTKAIAGNVAVTNGSATVTGTSTIFTSELKAGQQIVFASDSTSTPYTISAIASDTSLTLSSNYAGASTASTTASVIQTMGGCCSSMHTGPITIKDPGRLNAQTGSGSGNCTCQPTPAAGYLGLENQLYRVEIHQGGDESTATFKWSRENGSVVVAVTGTSGKQVYVDSLGPDANLGFAPDQWVEITDDSYQFGQDPNQPGNLYQIQSVNPQNLSVTMKQTVAPVNPALNARMRRWDQFGSSATNNGVSLSTAWVDLESGIQVEFSQGNYVSGDYWLIPARAATGNIEWPPCTSNGNAFQPSNHIEVNEAPLACIQWDTQKQSPHIQDCRKPFHPLTELNPASGCCCTCSVGDGVESTGDFTSIQAAIDSLPPEGGEVCILPGRYFEDVVIFNCRDIVIHGCGWQTRVASASLKASGTLAAAPGMPTTLTGATNPFGAVFKIVASQHIELRSFVVEAGTDEVGILIDGTTTSISTNQIANFDRLNIQTRGSIDVTIKDMVLTASTLPAILAERVELLRIDDNRVAMKNVASHWPAIYASGAEIHIDRNWVGVETSLTVREWLPFTVVEDLIGGSISQQLSPGASPEATAPDPAVTRQFIDSAGLNITYVEIPHHPGGIQIGGPSTDAYIIENEIEGGGRNGITLGSIDILDSNGKNTGQWVGVVVTGENDCCGTGTLQVSGNIPGQGGNTLVAGGILINIQIHCNRIRNMGMCGIGPVGFFNLLETLEVITIVGLNISSNAISRTMLRDLALNAGSTFDAYAAICIPDVQGLAIRDHTITDFGGVPGADVCGIFVLNGELIEISRNNVLETRDWSGAASATPAGSSISRGGIIIFLCTPPQFPQTLDNAVWISSSGAQGAVGNTTSTPIYEPGLPAARIEHNVVRVPLAYSLEILGVGPMTVVNNHLASGGLVPSKDYSIAQTALILNFGTAIETTNSANLPSNIFKAAQSSSNDLSPADFQNISCGAVLFSNNMCQLEATASQQSEVASVLIVTADHLIFNNNQCWLDTSEISALTDAFLLASTLNVIGNRFQESPASVLFSALTAGIMNVTGQNISTFCILVLGLLMSDNNNLNLLAVFEKGYCAELEKEIIALLG